MKSTSIAGIPFVFIGICLCYVAFETVRWAAWTMLTHMGGIAALVACGAVFWFWRKAKN